jgi:hypothetical protein
VPSLPFPVWLPPPLVGEPDWQSTVNCGSSDRSAKLSAEKITNYLGNPVCEPGPFPKGGEVRWYGVEFIKQNYASDPEAFKEALKLDFLRIDKSYVEPTTSPRKPPLALPLPEFISRPLAALRQAGTKLTPTAWSDDHVEFWVQRDSNGQELPGFAVIWRDDIPSRVLVLMDVAEYIRREIEKLASQFWDQTVNRQKVTVPIPIPLGEIVKVGVTRLAGEANDILAPLLQKNIVDASSSFQQCTLFDPDRNPLILGAYQDEFEPDGTGKEIAFGCQPVVSSTPLKADEAGEFSLQLNVEIAVDGNITMLKRTHYLKFKTTLKLGLPVVFHPEALVIPTLAIFFIHRIEVANDAYLIMLPRDTGLFGKNPDGSNREIHIDVDTPGDFNEVRLTIASKLGSLKSALDVVRFFGWNSPALDLISQVAATGYSIGTCIIDSSGEVDDLRKWILFHRQNDPLGDQTFDDAISAVVLIGAPNNISRTEIRCFQHPLFNQGNANDQASGGELRLSIPKGEFIAALPAFEDLSLSTQDCKETQAFDVRRPTVGTYVGTQAVSLPKFNDAITSIKFVTT